jgi:hypothetical protein
MLMNEGSPCPRNSASLPVPAVLSGFYGKGWGGVLILPVSKMLYLNCRLAQVAALQVTNQVTSAVVSRLSSLVVANLNDTNLPVDHLATMSTQSELENREEEQSEHGRPESWVERAARFGYGTKGILYIVVGTLSMRVAMGLGGEIEGPDEALSTIGEQPFGILLLIIATVGFFGYAAWRLIQAWADPDKAGSSLVGISTRLSYVVIGLIYIYFGYQAVQILTGNDNGEGNGNEQAEHWTGVLLAQPYGPWLVGAVGLGIVIGGLYQFYYGLGAKFEYKLDMEEMSDRETRWTIRSGQAGFMSWGVIFLVIGGFLIRGAVRYDPDDAMDMVEALEKILMQPYGPWLLGIVAAGLILYGVFHLILSYYRCFRLDISMDLNE